MKGLSSKRQLSVYITSAVHYRNFHFYLLYTRKNAQPVASCQQAWMLLCCQQCCCQQCCNSIVQPSILLQLVIKVEQRWQQRTSLYYMNIVFSCFNNRCCFINAERCWNNSEQHLTNRLHFSVCVCTVIDHRWRHSVWRTKKYTRRSRVTVVL